MSTLPPESFADPSAPTPGAGAPGAARTVVHAMRQIVATTLLAGNAVFLFLAVSDLIFTVDSWFGQFDARSAAVFGSFVGLLSIGLPLAAVLLATYVVPVLPQARVILVAALMEYAVSAFFGLITYLGAFVWSLPHVRPTFDGMLSRAVWFVFFAVAATMVYRIYRAMYPPAPKASLSYGPTVYGQPYPGQPSYPPRPAPAGYPPAAPGAAPTYSPAYGAPADAPTAEMHPAGIPPTAYPPAAFPAGASVPAQPAPAGFPPPATYSDPTVRMAPVVEPASAPVAPAEPGDATRAMPAVPNPTPPTE